MDILCVTLTMLQVGQKKMTLYQDIVNLMVPMPI